MTAAFSPFLALRYLWRRPVMILAVIGVTFAVWALLVVDGVFNGFVSDIRDNAHRASPDLLVTDLPRDSSFEELDAVLEPDQDVLHTAPRLRHHGLLRYRRPSPYDFGQTSSSVRFDDMAMDSGFAMLIGIDPLREPGVVDVASWLDRGEEAIAARMRISFPRAEVFDEPDEERRSDLLLPDAVEWAARGHCGLPREASPELHRSQWPGVLFGYQRLYSMLHLQPGDPLDLVTAEFSRAPDGTTAVEPRRTSVALAGFFATGHRLFDMNTALVPIETLRTLLGHDIASEGSIDLVTDVAIRLRPGLAAAEVAACKARLQAAVQRLLPPDAGPCAVLDWQQQNAAFLRAIDQEHSMMQFVMLVVMLLAGFVIYAMLHMMVVQKVKDIGILAAVGGSPASIGQVFVLCGLVVGGIGSALGSVLGWLSVTYLNDINRWFEQTWQVSLFPTNLFDLPVIPVRLDPSWIVQVALAALLLALVTALLPARKAARMDPVQALSYE